MCRKDDNRGRSGHELGGCLKPRHQERGEEQGMQTPGGRKARRWLRTLSISVVALMLNSTATADQPLKVAVINVLVSSKHHQTTVQVHVNAYGAMGREVAPDTKIWQV